MLLNAKETQLLLRSGVGIEKAELVQAVPWLSVASHDVVMSCATVPIEDFGTA